MAGFERFILRMSSRLRARLAAVRSDDGFTIVEVIVGATSVVLIAAGTLTALESTNRSATEQRHRQQANELAQQDQERLRGMTSSSLADLNEERQIGPIEGTTFTVKTTSQFVANAGGGSSCTAGGSGSADFVKVRSEVQWPTNLRAGRPAVFAESVITPPAGGTLVARVLNEAGSPLSGAKVDALGKGSYSATTNSSGCVIFGGMAVGGYYVLASKPGYVSDRIVEDNALAVTGVNTTASTTAQATLTLGEAGAIGAVFTTQAGDGGSPPVITNQKAPALSWRHQNWSSSRNLVPSAPASTITMPTRNLFPFITGSPPGYTNNYSAWAGRCDDTKPPITPTDLVPKASVSPGSTGSPTNATVKMPALRVTVYHRTGTSPSFVDTRIKPDNIILTDACGQRYRGDVHANAQSASLAPLGALLLPGQPYAPATDQMTVCADYDPPGSTPRIVATLTTANDNWVNGTLRNLYITNSTPGQCVL